MQIHVSKDSDVPIRQQIVEQIVFQITTEKLKPGQSLSSVRELARRLKIHHNTVSEAYQELVRRRWLVRQGPGTRLLVRPAEISDAAHAGDIDDFFNTVIRIGRERGYSLQALREKARARLLAAPPDHILVVEDAPGLRQLFEEEIRSALGWPVRSCSVGELSSNRNLALGAMVVAGQYTVPEIDPLLPKDHPSTMVSFCDFDDGLAEMLRLRDPSVIAAVSVSRLCLKIWRALFGSAAGRKHTLIEYNLPLDDPHSLDGADLVFCDSMAVRSVKHPHKIRYQLIAPESLDYIVSSMNSYQENNAALKPARNIFSKAPRLRAPAVRRRAR
jgi:DNA-binding transcriptional regulator YhcF (GntR family)